MKEKEFEYAAIISDKLMELFDEDSDGLTISKEDIEKGDNGTHFIHALANIVPTSFFNRFTKSDKNTLEFNHIANQLVFQYSKIREDKKVEG
jgi:hypothetical protein